MFTGFTRRGDGGYRRVCILNFLVALSDLPGSALLYARVRSTWAQRFVGKEKSANPRAKDICIRPILTHDAQ